MDSRVAYALRKIAEILLDQEVQQMVVGTTSLALQSVDILLVDIDIICNKKDTYKIGEMLCDYETGAVEFGRTSLFESHMGEYHIDGVKIEVMGDGTWTGLSGCRLESLCVIAGFKRYVKTGTTKITRTIIQTDKSRLLRFNLFFPRLTLSGVYKQADT